MNKSRLEAFSDGVIAIIITIMVLEMKVPHSDGWLEVAHLWPIFLSYALSFITVGIFWNNHHHLMHTVTTVNGGMMWANLHLLFWLSLLPFTSGWMGENHFASSPVALYSANQMMNGVAWLVLQKRIIQAQGKTSKLAQAIGRDWKGKVSALGFVIAIPLALYGYAWLGLSITMAMQLLWLIPDRRIEEVLNKHTE